jgi:SAM-dependent methyltransferase
MDPNLSHEKAQNIERDQLCLSPYISFVESRLFPGVIQRAAFHRLTGDLIEATDNGDNFEFTQLIQKQFLIPKGYDPLAPLLDHYVIRPIQNPAVAYRSKSGEWILVRTSMEHTVYSRRRDELPSIIEEKLSPLTADILLMADGTKTLRQIFSALRSETSDALGDSEFRAAIDFLTTQERQLIKFTQRTEDLNNPFSWPNIVPRNLYHSDRRDQPRPDSANETIIDFHLHEIEDAGWEFDLIEPTVNHCFRFPHEALGGLDYGSRFCLATLRPEVVPLLNSSSRLDVLEVGGGTGSFARSFIKQAAHLNGTNINYHILDLSPALMENQRKTLSELLPESRHFQQNATEFDLPGRTFDLIISNEVIADFPVAPVQRTNGTWQGEGAYYMDRYDLSDKDAPDTFVVNAGAFCFIERAWKHLKPGGTLIVSEYGSDQMYPRQSYHLNHEEYSIHFGHLAACATKVGFECRLLTLKQFLPLDDDVLVLNGREEHLLCLNYVLKSYGQVLPYAVISKSDFEERCQRIVEETGLIGYSFSPLNKGYHYGPNTKDFFVLIMNKPRSGQEEI